MKLSKLTESTSTITLGWTPPANVGGYVLYAAGRSVAVASTNLKDGTPRKEAKFSKTSPGPPYEVVATCRPTTGYVLDVGKYPEAATQVIHPGPNVYPSEVMP